MLCHFEPRPKVTTAPLAVGGSPVTSSRYTSTLNLTGSAPLCKAEFFRRLNMETAARYDSSVPYSSMRGGATQAPDEDESDPEGPDRTF